MDYTNILTHLTYHLDSEYQQHAESLANAIYTRAKDFSHEGLMTLILSVAYALNEGHVTLDAILDAIEKAEGGQ